MEMLCVGIGLGSHLKESQGDFRVLVLLLDNAHLGRQRRLPPRVLL